MGLIFIFNIQILNNIVEERDTKLKFLILFFFLINNEITL